MILQPHACYQSAIKPSRLSDPGCDFTEEALADLLQKSVQDLDWSDFQNLFGPFLPAGTYDELRYYVPLFVAFLIQHPEHRLDLVTSWAWFSSTNWDRIVQDGCDEYIREVHRCLLRQMTKQFSVRHYNLDECKKKGWSRQYKNYVVGTESVNEFLSDLWRFEIHRDIAKDFIRDLSEFKDDIDKCGWFVELSRSRYDVYKPPDDEQITSMLSDKSKLESALNLVLALDLEGTYWDDTFGVLGV